MSVIQLAPTLIPLSDKEKAKDAEKERLYSMGKKVYISPSKLVLRDREAKNNQFHNL